MLVASAGSILAKLKHDSAAIVIRARAAPGLRRSETVLVEGHGVIGSERRWIATDVRFGHACAVDAC